MIDGLIAWTTGWASSPYGPVALFIISFAESSFFPIPPDVLMIPLALARPQIALLFALITTIASVLGGLFGYFMGKKGGRPILDKFFSQEKILAVEEYYNRYDWWAILIAAFTPIPYKLFTISAGVFKLDLKRFIFASILGRGGRFFLVAGAIMLFGDTIKSLLDRYFELFTLALMVLLIGGFFAVRFLIGRKK